MTEPLLNDVASLVSLARDWNRHVPRAQKARVTPPPAFDVFLASALDDPYLADCLEWIQRTVSEGYGLILDW